jgi:hypothetical protein
MGAMLALALAVPLLFAAGGECYFVSNTRIVVLPECDFSPEALAPLEAAEPPPARTARAEPPRREGGPPRRTRAFQRGGRSQADR